MPKTPANSNPRNAGAKPKYGVPTQRMVVRVPEPIADRIALHASAIGKTRSEVVVEVLDAGVPGAAPAGGAFE